MGKIPPHATRVFKGVIFDVYQWEQEMFDGTKAVFEIAKRQNTIVVLPMIGNQVCYSVQRQPGKEEPFLALFGGRAEGDEEPLVTAKRELMEESGLESDDWEPWFTYYAHSKLDWSVYYFIARNCRKVAEPELDGGEEIEVRQTSVGDFIENIIPHATFYETELKQRLCDTFNPAKAAELKTLLTNPKPNA